MGLGQVLNASGSDPSISTEVQGKIRVVERQGLTWGDLAMHEAMLISDDRQGSATNRRDRLGVRSRDTRGQEGQAPKW